MFVFGWLQRRNVPNVESIGQRPPPMNTARMSHPPQQIAVAPLLCEGLPEELFVGVDAESLPRSFICPITHQIMRNPVIDREGNSWERTAIETWLRTGNRNSPLTGRCIRSSDLASNRALRDAIEEHIRNRNRPVRSDNPVESSANTRRWSECANAKVKTLTAVAEQLRLNQLTDRQRSQVEEVFGNGLMVRDDDSWSPQIDAAYEFSLAVSRCQWLLDSKFRMRVYGEFAQWLHPQAEFETLGKLQTIVKQDAEKYFLYSLSKPDLTSDLERIRDAISEFSRVYKRGPRPDDERVLREQEARWRYRWT